MATMDRAPGHPDPQEAALLQALSAALAHVAGYTCFLDGSVRDFQKHSFTAGKNFDSSGACGP